MGGLWGPKFYKTMRNVIPTSQPSCTLAYQRRLRIFNPDYGQEIGVVSQSVG